MKFPNLKALSLSTLTLGSLLLFPNIAASQSLVLKQEIFSPNPNQNEKFGASVAIDGDDFVIGAPSVTGFNNSPSRVYLYNPDGTINTTYSNPNDPGFIGPIYFSGEFGTSVAIHNNNIVLGAPNNSVGGVNSGEAFLFSPGNTTPEQTFQSINPTSAGRFGQSVAIYGSNVVIGAPFEDSQNGNAYLFGLDGILKSSLNVPSGNSGQLGFSTAIYDNNIIIGAPFADGQASFSGASYLFDSSGSYQFTLGGLQTGSQYGYSVDISDTYIAIGAKNQNISSNVDTGKVFIYDLAGNLIQQIDNPDLTTMGYFGTDVSISGDSIFIGATGNDSGNGVFYEYDILTGALAQTFTNENPDSGDLFGASIDASGGQVIVGAPEDDTQASGSGAGYLYGQSSSEVPEGNTLAAIAVAGLSLLWMGKKNN